MVKLFYKNLYLKSLLPHEVLSFIKKNNLNFELEKESKYVSFWKENICKNASQESFDKYCYISNFSKEDIQLMTGDHLKINLINHLSFWVKTLKKILKKIDTKEYKNEHHLRKKPFSHLLLPFVSFFSSELKENLEELNIKTLNNSLLSDIESELYNELFKISNNVFFSEFSKYLTIEKERNNRKIINEEDFYYKKFINSILSNNCQDLFLNYPMLARKLATKTHRYINFISDFFKRFEKDRNEIASWFNNGERIEIRKVQLNLGDQHNGCTTMLVELDNSDKIIYKPTNVNVTIGYNHLLAWVNFNLKEDLKTFRIIDRKEYGWLEFIKDFDCLTEDEVKIYYKRAGILVGLTYFLNSRDYHYENIIASGSCPVLIDHETIVGPKIKNPHINNDTVLESLLLPSPNNIQRECGLGSSSLKSKDVVLQKVMNPNTDNMRKVPNINNVKMGLKNIPKLNNKSKYLIDYKAEFKEGFENIYDLVLHHKELLLSDESPLRYFKNLQIRHLNRSTSVYGKILNILTGPEYLKDSIKYGLKLEVLARAYLNNEEIVNLLHLEREQMILDDIPVFYFNTNDKYLHLLNGKKVDIFNENTMNSVSNKIRNANLKDYDLQMALIEKAIAI